MRISRRQLSGMIDHTLLKPAATKEDIKRLCEEAEKHSFGFVCVNPAYVSFASRLLKGTEVRVCSVVGFPFGATLPEVKAFEADAAVRKGASEIDMVLNIGALKSGDYDLARRDVEEVVEVKNIHDDVLVKVIIEAGQLTHEEKIAACELVKEAGADFVKTSTGFFGGATVEDVKLLRKTAGEEMGVKAAGGIRTLRDALAMIEAGANRIGASSGVAIIKEFTE